MSIQWDCDALLRFWFEEHPPEAWFAKDDGFDADLRARFGALRDTVAGDPALAWELSSSARDALAVVILLDQFSRNLYRGSPEAFATDALARDLARVAIARGFHVDPTLPPGGALFFYLPFEHSESLADQEWSCALMAEVVDAEQMTYALRHRDIIRRFGRFPHRNAALGRVSTEEEAEFLTQPGSSF